jgi:hypothetical protein
MSGGNFTPPNLSRDWQCVERWLIVVLVLEFESSIEKRTRMRRNET